MSPLREGKEKCTATSKQSGKRCERYPAMGSTVCKSHGGGSPQAKRKAAERVATMKAEQKMEKAIRTLGLRSDKALNPADVLLEEIAWTHAHVLWLRSKVQELEPDELTWGKVDHEERYGPLGAIDKTTQKAAPNVWYQLYMTEREHLAKVSTMALRAGIEERRVKLAEEQGNMVAAVVNRILNALNLSPAQWEQVPEVVPREFRALASLE